MAAADESGVGRRRELRRLRSSLMIGALPLLAAWPAAASELLWEGPPGCASGDALSFELERALGVPLERAGRLRFSVRVERSESMASARLEVSNLEPTQHARAKRRLLVAEDCSTLVDTLAVAIGLAIGASETQRPSAINELEAHAARHPTGAPEVSAPPAATKPRPQAALSADAAADDPSSADRAGLRSSVFFDLLGDGGALPNLALGATLGVALHTSRAAARVSGTLLLDQRVQVAVPERRATAELGLRFVSLQGCLDGASTPTRWALPVCVGVDLGQLWARGVDIARARREASWWVAPRFDAGLFWSVPGTTIRAGGWLTASAPLKRDEFVVDDVGLVHRPGPVVGRIAIGLDASLE